MTQRVFPREALMCSPWPRRGPHVFPFTFSAPAAMFSLPETPGKTTGIGDTPCEALIPWKAMCRVRGCLRLCVSIPLLPFVRLRLLCDFILRQNCSLWACSAFCLCCYFRNIENKFLLTPNTELMANQVWTPPKCIWVSQ